MVEAALPVSLRRNDIFISYSRRDKAFVQRLVDAFRAVERDPWIDWEDIAEAEAWRPAIVQGIREADTFLFVISPDAIASVECTKELQQAIQFNKRIIPIMHRETPIPDSALSDLQWMFFRATDDFEAAFQKLLAAIDKDLKHAQVHTRWLIRALEWEDGRDDGSLLRGKDLKAAETWMANCADKNPHPTELHRQYIAKSREVETAEKRLVDAGRKATQIIGLSIFCGLVAGAVIAIALYQAYDRISILNRQQQLLSTEIQQQESEINKLVSIQQQLSQDRKRLILELEKFGWTEDSINALLNSSEIEIASRLAQARAANASYQKTLKNIKQGQAAAPPPAPTPHAPTADASSPQAIPSASPAPSSVTVEYTPKQENIKPVSKAFSRLGLTLQPSETQPSSTPNSSTPNNVIFYGKAVSPEQVKAVAYTLIRAGTEIRAIQPLSQPEKGTTIQVGASADFQSRSPLTVEQIRDSALPLLQGNEAR